MDFLKRHYDKVVLAGALLLLIGSGVYLAFRVGALSTEIEDAPRRLRQKGKNTTQLDLGTYSNAIVSINEPKLWSDASVDPFFPGRFTGPGPEGTPTGGNGETNLPVLVRIERELFKMLFLAYSYDAGAGEAYNFQLNLQFRPRTFFVRKVGDRVKERDEDTGYVLAKFERKTAMVEDPSLPGKPRERDVSEVTLQHAGEEPIILIVGQPAEQREPVASVQCSGAMPAQKVRRGQQFGCPGASYNVVDITLTCIVILDAKSGERHNICLPAARQ